MDAHADFFCWAILENIVVDTQYHRQLVLPCVINDRLDTHLEQVGVLALQKTGCRP